MQGIETATPPDRVGGWAGWLFAAIWLIYLGYPLRELFDGKHSAGGMVDVLVPVAAFCLLYIRLSQVAEDGPPGMPAQRIAPRKLLLLGGMAAIALVLPLVAEPDWVVLWIYVSSGCGYSLPVKPGKPVPSIGLRLGLLAAAVMTIETLALGASMTDVLAALMPAVLSCAGTAGIRRMQLLISELRQARAEVARLAATEERLRMARDLHDLAGHSLATITLKAELARKLLPVDLGRAEQQMLDLEQVSRQALADIREAVSGYRRATLAVEIASARTALEVAGIALDADPTVALRSGEFAPEVEQALAWCLREAVTNVVRHSGARTCRIRLIEARVDGESTITLEVTDDGAATAIPVQAGAPASESAASSPAPQSPADAPPRMGNGLSGLCERLHAVSAAARLVAAPVPGGFRLTATLPNVSKQDPES